MRAKEKEIRVKTEKTFLYKRNRILRKNTTPLVNEKDVGNLKRMGLISEIKSKGGYEKKVVLPKEIYKIKNVEEITHKKIIPKKVDKEDKDKDEIKLENGFYIIPGGKKYKSKRGAKKAMDRKKNK